MSEVTTQFDVDAPATPVWAALTTGVGITSWWTTQAEDPDGPGESGTRILFDHVGWQDAEEMVRIVTFGWVEMFLRLTGFVESGKPQPYFDF